MGNHSFTDRSARSARRCSSPLMAGAGLLFQLVERRLYELEQAAPQDADAWAELEVVQAQVLALRDVVFGEVSA